MNFIAKWMTATTHACLACALSVVLFSTALPGEEVEARSVTYQLNIPAESLDAALQALALASHHKLLYRAELVAGKTSRALVGTFTAEEAVRQLLSGTDLGFDITPASVVLIKNKDEGKSGEAAVEIQPPSASAATSSSAAPEATPSDNKSSRDRLRLAQVDQGTNTQTHPVTSDTTPQGNTKKGELTEIIVTAQKKSERLQDVPVPVTVLDADTLAESDQNRLQDYFASVPGLSLNAGSYGGAGQQNIAIRGLTTSSFSNPTVGLTIDEVPFGSSTAEAWGAALYPDIDPSDLERVEVLRGPQGTLYGANSIGGLIQYVTKDPTTTDLNGRLQVIGSDVAHGEGGYGVRGAVNVPISDTLAVRISGFTRRDPGYIENVTTRERDVNQTDAYGGRLSALWRPSEAVSLKLSAILK